MTWEFSFDAHVFIDHLLVCARRIQDFLVTYISKVLRRSLSSSMDTLATTIQKYQSHLDGPIGQLISGYWRANGARLRDYRVLSEHHGQLATDCRFIADASGALTFFCGLPNNLTERKAESLSWEPAVNSYPYLRDEFAALIAFVRSIASELLVVATGCGPVVEGGVVFSFRAPFVVNQGGGQIPPENDVDELLKALAAASR